MASKGASNHFGNARGASKGRATEFIGYARAKDFNKHRFNYHYTRHGKEMGFTDEKSYKVAAIHFANYIDRKNCISFIDKSGSTHKFNQATEEYAIINKKGYVITYYKLNNGIVRFENERNIKNNK